MIKATFLKQLLCRCHYGMRGISIDIQAIRAGKVTLLLIGFWKNWACPLAISHYKAEQLICYLSRRLSFMESYTICFNERFDALCIVINMFSLFVSTVWSMMQGAHLLSRLCENGWTVLKRWFFFIKTKVLHSSKNILLIVFFSKIGTECKNYYIFHKMCLF